MSRCRPLPAVAAGLAATLALAAPAAADQVIPDDLIVQGSLCAGPACVNNESFGFDTLRLKGPVLRFGFEDTSTAPGFPTTDWELTANDADGAGAASYFAFGDVSAGTMPLRIEAGAPTDALRVELDGATRLGAGPLVQQVDGTTTEGAAAVDGAALVTALGSLPIARYEYAADPLNRRRLGPTAADFNAAFGVGAGANADLAPADVAGVALAAAKQLTARVASLEGPVGATGPKGDPGADAAAPAPSTAFDDAVAKLGGLERSDRRLRKRNRTLRDRVARLERQLRALRRDR